MPNPREKVFDRHYESGDVRTKNTLAEIASVDFFRSTPSGVFRSELAQCVQETLSRSSRTLASRRSPFGSAYSRDHDTASPVVRFDGIYLTEIFATLDWKKLCEDHDTVSFSSAAKARDGKSEEITTQSTLSEIIDVLKNPIVVPQCCEKPLATAFLYAILASPRQSAPPASTPSLQRWTPSQALLLSSIQACPPSTIRSFVTDFSFSRSPNQCNRLLSVIYWLVNKCRDSRQFELLMAGGLLLLRRIDDWDIQKLSVDRQEHLHDTKVEGFTWKGTAGICSECKGIVSDSVKMSRAKNLKLANLSDLHETSIGEHCYKQNDFLRRRPYERSHVSLKKVLNARSTSRNCNCEIPSRQMTQQCREQPKISKLSKDWSIVRSRAYKKFFTFLATAETKPSFVDLNGSLQPQVNPIDILSEAVEKPQSPALRVCLALLGHNFPLNYLKIALICWQRHQQQPAEQASEWLRTYSEFICDLAFFDQRIYAWRAFQPLVQAILKMSESEVDGNDSGRHFSRRESLLLNCLGYILMKRSRLFESKDDKKTDAHDTISSDFQSFVNTLSIHYGNSSVPWLCLFSNNDDNQELVISTLQRLGILGISALETKKEEANASAGTASKFYKTDDELRNRATASWPFGNLFSIRCAMERIERDVLSLDGGKNVSRVLLARRPHELNHLDARKRKKGSGAIMRANKKRKSADAVFDYLHDDDIFAHIFSFSGFRRLVKIQQVCKKWKSIVDSRSEYFWEDCYIKKFGSFQGSRPTQMPWKDLFVRKYITEQSIRYKRNSRSGYKYRTCSYLGCLQILRTSDQERKHTAMHQRLARESAKRERKQRTKKGQKNSEAFSEHWH